MRKILLIFTVLSFAILMSITAWGCKNPDQGTEPTVPPPNLETEPMDPDIPDPFSGDALAGAGSIIDIAIEGDGDLVFSTMSGTLLFTPYGVLKRSMGGGLAGLATSNFGVVDTGRGIIGLGAGCSPSPLYDDMYVQGGVPGVTYDMFWWAGEPDPYYPDICVPIASTSSFTSCDCNTHAATNITLPHPIAYHPVTAYAYQKVFTPECIADSDCDWPITNAVPVNDSGILAYHPDTPLPPDYMTMIFEGGQDYLVYYDYPTMFALQMNAAMVYLVDPACVTTSHFIAWDLTDMNFMSSRDGMTASNICDFEFDMLNRLIIAMPNADSVVITDPVVFGDAIVIQQTLGGRQNGMGTLPGEFQGPAGVAIDPRNQNILISDTGNGRVQVFDNDGNFIREFGGADANFMPGAIRVDSFGAIYVANVNEDAVAAGDLLRIFNEYGAGIEYGTIEGYVYDKDSHIPIDNARVRAQSTFMPLDTFTDEQGFFSFPAIASGTHDLVGEKYGYNSGNVTVTLAGGQKALTDIYLDRIGITTPGFGTVIGTVFSTLYNEPVPGLTAEVVGSGASSQTNGNGEFTLYNVPEGDYTFRLTANGVIYYEKYIIVTQGGITDIGWLYLPIP